MYIYIYIHELKQNYHMHTVVKLRTQEETIQTRKNAV